MRVQARTGAGLGDEGLPGLRVVPIDEEIGRVVADHWAFEIAGGATGSWVGPQAEEGLLNAGLIVRKLEHRLSGGRIDRGAVGGQQRSGDLAHGGIAGAGEILPFRMDIVEKIGDEARGDRDRSAFNGLGSIRIAGFPFQHYGRGRAFHGESADELRLAVVGQPEILLG